nr:sodium:proton antiporter [Lachnospiraceae bacterium]
IMFIGNTLMRGDSGFALFILVIGLCTMVIGAVTAIFSVNLKKILACSSVSQIGFMLTGIGAGAVTPFASGEEIAFVGTVIHMSNHTLVKLVVFLTAGVVFENLHALNLNDIKGFGQKKPALAIPYVLAAVSLAGIPGFMGYYSKSIIHEALVECAHTFNPSLVTFMEWVFLISGGATLCYMAKIFKVLFIDKPVKEMPAKAYLNPAQAVAVILPSIVILAASIYLPLSNAEYAGLLEFEVLKGGLTSVAIGIILFTVTTLTLNKGEVYRDIWPEWLDLEAKVYRPLLLSVLPLTVGFVARIMDKMGDGLVFAIRKTILRDSPLPAERVEGTILTHVVGRTIDVFRAFFKGEHVVRNTTERHMALRNMEVEETMKVFRRSLSYGLLLACIGIFIILGFILYLVYLR